MSNKILLWGAGSQAKIIKAMIEEQGLGEAIAIVDTYGTEMSSTSNLKVIDSATSLSTILSSVDSFVVTIGAHYGYARHKIASFLRHQGLRDPSIIHPTAFIDPTVEYQGGLVAMPGVVVNKFSQIGSDTILNTNCSVDHDAVIGHGVHIMGAAALAGRITVGNYATIGTNATILPDLHIGEGSYVGAGSVVLRNVEEDKVVVGVPAHEKKPSVRFFDDALIRAFEALP